MKGLQRLMVRRLFTCGVAACIVAVGVHAQEQAPLTQMVHRLSNSPLLRHAQWSVYARYADGGEPLINFKGEEGLAPASCLKVVTTAAGLELLGPDYRFETKLFYTGTIGGDSVLHGNLVIVGGGDPTLGSDLVPGSMPLDRLMASWVAAVRTAGIARIEGGVVADDFALDRIPIPDQWFWIDIGNYYATSTSALTINDNLYRLIFRPARRAGARADLLRMEPEIPGLVFDNHMRTGPEGSGDNGYIYCAPRQYNATLRGTVPAGPDEFEIKGAIPDPPLFAAQHTTLALSAAGVSVRDTASKAAAPSACDSSHLLIKTVSPPLRDIITIINKRSFNLYAEQLLKAIGLRVGGEGSTAKGVEAVEHLLQPDSTAANELSLEDGSGLSRSNSIATQTIVDLLIRMVRSPNFPAYYASFSVAGDPTDIGFFKSFGVGTEVAMNAHIKSGSIQGVRSHAGYIRDRNNRLIAFAMIANNYGRRGRVDQVHKDILVELARLEVVGNQKPEVRSQKSEN